MAPARQSNVVVTVVVRTVVLVVSCVMVVVRVVVLVPVVLVPVVGLVNVVVLVAVVLVPVLVEASVAVWLLVFVVTVVTVVLETVTVKIVVAVCVVVSVVTVVLVSVKVVVVTVAVVVVDVGRPCPAQSALSDEVPPTRKVWVLFSRVPRTSRLNPNCSTSLNSTVAAMFASWVFRFIGSAGQVTSSITDGEEKTVPPSISSVVTKLPGVRKCASKPLIETFS